MIFCENMQIASFSHSVETLLWKNSKCAVIYISAGKLFCAHYLTQDEIIDLPARSSDIEDLSDGDEDYAGPNGTTVQESSELVSPTQKNTLLRRQQRC